MRAQAYWTTGPGHGELREEDVPAPGPGEALVRSLVSGVSLGTETLVLRGEVPPEVTETMRAPFQVGDFPWPVKYGYLSVGVVETHSPGENARSLTGRRVFCLHPHQDRYVVPEQWLTPVPDDVPTTRAVLAGTVETALNAVWDASPRYGDRVAVVGLGMVGTAVALLLNDFPLSRLQLLDVDPAKAQTLAQHGLCLTDPADADDDCDLVVHCSATEAGLVTALRLAGKDAEIVEVSWYGTRAPRVPLGAQFHARRLTLKASQVAAVSPARRARRTTADRLAAALGLLGDNRFDTLLGRQVAFADLPAFLHRSANGGVENLCHVVTYPSEA